MELVVLIVLIAIAVGLYLVYNQQKQAQSQTKSQGTGNSRPVDPLAGWNSAGGDGQFYSLKPGDLVKLDDGDFLVRGTLRFNDGGSQWAEHLLDDATGNKRWLSVEDDDGLELAFWERVPMADVESGTPGERAVVIRGVAYKLVEKGTASFDATGSTSTTPSGNAEYIDYEAADGRLLGFERYDGSAWEVSLGRKARPSEFDIYPAEQGV